MNEWKALYLKELKENRTVFVFLLAITAVASMVSTAAAGWDSTTPSSFFAPSTFSYLGAIYRVCFFFFIYFLIV